MEKTGVVKFSGKPGYSLLIRYRMIMYGKNAVNLIKLMNRIIWLQP